MKTTVKFNFKYFEDPVSVYQETIKRYKDLNGAIEIPLSPWDQFRKIFKDVSRYADPAELKQLVVDYGLSELNDVFGIENVESMASGGQIIDVFRRTPNKDYTTVINKLLGPLGGLL